MSDSIQGFSISSMFNTVSNTISKAGSDLNAKLQNLSSADNLSQEEMLQLQFEVNMYNTLLETASTVSKSLTDEAKQLAQRSS